MEMPFWLEKAKAAVEEFAWCEPRAQGRCQKTRSLATEARDSTRPHLWDRHPYSFFGSWRSSRRPLTAVSTVWPSPPAIGSGNGAGSGRRNPGPHRCRGGV